VDARRQGGFQDFEGLFVWDRVLWPRQACRIVKRQIVGGSEACVWRALTHQTKAILADRFSSKSKRHYLRRYRFQFCFFCYSETSN
jgi:hypothetical protein